ncbi:hypothetical protein CFter6_0137 [Collimonas fungivorans]|uniref:Uncharacterized protein n=1 Tax=Collimonas fungivorans TaxID=158899 RepID=A0A127P4U8_9BURK|nr:hypothetical protein CFter6_0137 [Collimonas fungivorans]
MNHLLVFIEYNHPGAEGFATSTFLCQRQTADTPNCKSEGKTEDLPPLMAICMSGVLESG